MIQHINLLAVLAAGVANFVLGALWYSPLMFVKPWQAEIGADPNKKADMKAMGPRLAATFVLGLVQAYVFAMFIGYVSPPRGALYGVAAGLCWVAAAFGINYIFAGRSFRLFLIDGGFNVVVFTLYGLILGAWH